MPNRSSKFTQPDDANLVESVRGSVDRIWQAGLGAFAKAQQDGEEMFSKMVEEGADVQKRIQDSAEEKLTGLTDTVAKMAEKLNVQAAGSWEKLENVFEDRMSRSLHSIGVPTRNDIETLAMRIGELQRAVHELTAKKSPRKASAKTATRAATKAPAKQAIAKTAKKQATAKTAKPTKTVTKAKTTTKAKSTKSTAAKRAVRFPTQRASVSAASRA